MGNVFTIIRQGDPILQDVGSIPAATRTSRSRSRTSGSAWRVDVRETVTTCLLVRSLREIVAGDRVEMRAGAAQTAHR